MACRYSAREAVRVFNYFSDDRFNYDRFNMVNDRFNYFSDIFP